MKTFYHSLFMWIPFILLFSFAAFGLEVFQGDKIRKSEYVGYLFILSSFAFILFPISFLPLTIVVCKVVESLISKIVIFTFFGGVIGAFTFKRIYDWLFVEEYNLSMISSIIFFSMAGLLYALVENSLKKNIKFD